MRIRGWTGRRLPVITTIVAMALVVAACSSGTDSGSDTSEGAGGSDVSSTTTQADERPKVAALFTQFVDQGNWDPAGYAAYEAMCEKYDFDCTFAEDASYEQAPALLRGFAEDGYAMVITHSSGYSAAIEEVAPDFPDTEFVMFSWALDTFGLDNYTAWSVNWAESGYMEGVIAALSTTTDTVAVVIGEEIPSLMTSVENIKAVVAEYDPDITVVVGVVGSFIDAAKAKEVTLALINDGAGFVIPKADTAGTGIKQAAEEQGIMTLGEYVDESSLFPDAIVTSLLVDFNTSYDEMGQGLVDGTLDGQIVQLGLETGTLDYTRPFNHVNPSVQTEIDRIIQEVIDGTIVVN